MKPLFSRRNTRYTAIVMLFVWLATLGIGIANACLPGDAHGHPGPVQQLQATVHAEADEHAPDPDEVICLNVCAAQQSAAIKVKPFDNAADSRLPLIAWAPALAIALVDPDDRPTPLAVQTWREPPVSIRFLRLTL